MNLSVHEDINGGTHTLSLCGEITVGTAPVLEDAVSHHLDSAQELIFDMENCTYTSSVGIRIFLSAYKALLRRNGKMRMIHVNDTIRDVLECVNMAELFGLEEPHASD